VQQAGGAISVSSKVGQGTTFYLLLPATDAPLEEEAAALGNIAGGSETILLAEDEPAVLDLVRRILTGAGYTVLPARTGEAAAELIERSPHVELLLTDLVMPGMGGKELARRLTTRDPKLRVLYMSGYVDEPGQLNDDDAPLLHKPFAREELLDRVRRTLDAQVA
jgi:CheY-like chemotaxis protein